MKIMRIFQTPQGPFLEKEFIEMLARHINIKYIDGIPTIAGKTYFWSTEKFQHIKKQFILNTNIANAKKFFYVKEPSSYENGYQKYHKHFKNQLKKAGRFNLKFSKIHNPTEQIIQKCYAIYDQNMENIHTFSFAYAFFESLTKLSFASLFIIRHDTSVISFGLMLGNHLFIQSSTAEGRKMCANNFLYDRIFNEFENEAVFLGIASKNNIGLTHFKKQAGLSMIPAKATRFDFTDFLPGIFRDNKVVGYAIRKIDNQKILKYALPY